MGIQTEINSDNNLEYKDIKEFLPTLKNWESLILIENDGDVFILTKHNKNYIWYGIKSYLEIRNIFDNETLLIALDKRKFKKFLGKIILTQ